MAGSFGEIKRWRLAAIEPILSFAHAESMKGRMQGLLKRIAEISLALIAMAGLYGCATTESGQSAGLATPPPMGYAKISAHGSVVAGPVGSIKAKQAPASAARQKIDPEAANKIEAATSWQEIDFARIEAEMRAHNLRLSQLEFSDQNYIVPSQKWLRRVFIPYALDYLAKNDLFVRGEGLDCDNIAQMIRHQLAISNVLGGQAGRGDVPCALMKVQQVKPFGGVAGDNSYHSLLLARTDKGWFAIEPQTGAMARLAQYPNRPYIEWALF